MGDISELRGLVVVLTALGTFALLVSWMPSELFVATEGRTISPPDIFETVDVFSYAETKTIRMNETGGVDFANYYWVQDCDLGNRDLDFFYKDANESNLDLWVDHSWLEWLIIPVGERLRWVNSEGIDRGTTLTVGEMALDQEANNSTVNYRLVSDRWNFQYFASFAFNHTLYGGYQYPWEASWNFHGLYFFMAVNFDQVNTSFNAFHLIALLLFFQLPDVNVYVNALIAIPLWVNIAYLVYVLIIKVIPFIAGG